MTDITDITVRITGDDVTAFIASGKSIVISTETKARLNKVRAYLEEKTVTRPAPIYGVNTGFGSLCNTVIAADELGTLQQNLLMSHACGMGAEVPREVVRIMLVLKVRGLLYGYSGIQPETVELLAALYNHGITPVVYEQGSLGASGDLAPLSHLCLPLIGLGEVYVNEKKMAAAEALASAGLKPVALKSKEGLALINGTQFMSAYSVYCVSTAKQLIEQSLIIAGMSLDAYDGRIDAFHPNIHHARPHVGQVYVAGELISILEGSEIASQEKPHVQDPYSFRCIPQVMGASLDALHFVEGVVNTEINATTDNPLIFPDEDLVISGGNFHGQPLALALDFLAIALAEIGSISERRTYKLIGGQRGLPAYLAKNPGLNSGFMIPQYTAASIVSQNKQLCTPSSVDSIDSSNGQEDHVSMGANAATKAYRIVQNLRSIVAIEWLTAAQALEFRRPLKSSPQVEAMHKRLREHVPFGEQDVYLGEQMKKVLELV
jgi:histidine ammonia-lyase